MSAQYTYSLYIDLTPPAPALVFDSESRAHVSTQLVATPPMAAPPGRGGLTGAIMHVTHALSHALAGAPILLASVTPHEGQSGYHDPEDARSALISALQSFSGLDEQAARTQPVRLGLSLVRSVYAAPLPGWTLIKRRRGGQDSDLVAEGYVAEQGLPLTCLWDLHEYVHAHLPAGRRHSHATHDALLTEALIALTRAGTAPA